MKRKKQKKSQVEKDVDLQVDQKGSQAENGLTRRKFFQLSGTVGLGSAAAFALGGLSTLPACNYQTYGYTGRVLWVDLKRRRGRIVMPNESVYRDYLGGYGLGARLIYDELKKSRRGFTFDALSSDNVLGFATGILTGAEDVLVGSRFTVMAAKSPLTGSWADANTGGYWGPWLKQAGFDAVFFTGKSKRPVYLYIEEGNVEIKNAEDLWGKDTYETEDSLKSELGEDIQVASIGPSGEKLSPMAGVMTFRGKAAGRGGLGAVMGSKNLKAVVVQKGTNIIDIYNKTEKNGVDEISSEIRNLYYQGKLYNVFHDYGTSGFVEDSSLNGDSAVMNWAGVGEKPAVDFNPANIDGVKVVEKQIHKQGCWGCGSRDDNVPLACSGRMHKMVTDDPDSPFYGQYDVEDGGPKPQYETLTSFGTNCLNDDLDSLIKVNDICNRNGIDTISVGCTIAFAMECNDNGLLDDYLPESEELTWGNHQAIVALTEKIAKCEGELGKLLSKGSAKAAIDISGEEPIEDGPDAKNFTMHIKGQEIGMHDFRFSPSMAVTNALDATPACHVQGGAGILEFLRDCLLEGTIPYDIYEFDPVSCPTFIPVCGELKNNVLRSLVHKGVTFTQHCQNATGLCIFAACLCPPSSLGDPDHPPYPGPDLRYLNAVTGYDMSVQDYFDTGERIYAMRMAFNMHYGDEPMNRVVPERNLKPMVGQDLLTDISEDAPHYPYQLMKGIYLSVIGWDPSTGWPYSDRLCALGLSDIAEDIYGSCDNMTARVNSWLASLKTQNIKVNA